MKKLEWKKIPTDWVLDNPFLSGIRFQGDNKADQIAALMLYIALVHQVSDNDDDLGKCRSTYETLSEMTGLSRSKISGGLNLLEQHKLISRLVKKRGAASQFLIIGYDCFKGWAKLPLRGLYKNKSIQIRAFHHFKLRSKVELDALKIYFLILRAKNRKTGYAEIGYTRIWELLRIHQTEIRSALSLLVTLGLIQVDKKIYDGNKRPHNIYRICHVDPHLHRGTESISDAIQTSNNFIEDECFF